MDYIGTKEAARRLGVSQNRVWQFIKRGRLIAVRMGRDWYMTEESVNAFVRHPVGWPKGRKRKVG